ncbi:MAG: hypothetical protein JSV33_13580 [bacterium]|nr:MAG: hypothetical protein JSV33_13580 [bacterium]
MRPRTRCLIILGALLLRAGALHAGPEFILRSRSLLQGPTKTAAFYEGGFVLGTGGGIVVLSPAGTLETMAFLPVDGEPVDIVVQNDVAYLAAMRGGLITVDLSDPRNPRQISTRSMRQATDCTVSGIYLFVADFNRKLHTFDISKPFEPVLKDAIRLARPLVSLAAEGDLITLISSHKVIICMVRENGTLRKLTSIKPPKAITTGALTELVLYLVTGDGELLRYSLADPSSPERLDAIAHGSIVDIAIDGSRGLLLTSSQGVIPFTTGSAGKSHNSRKAGARKEIDQGSIPAQITVDSPLDVVYDREQDTIEKPWNALRNDPGMARSSGGKKFAITFSDDLFVTLAGREGPRFYRVEGNRARLIAGFPTRGFAIDLIASGDLLYVSNGQDGVRIGRVGVDGTVDWIGHIQTVEARDIALHGDHLFVADGKDGLKAVDVSDPCNPRIVSALPSPFYHSAIVTRGKRAYIAGGLGGVEIYDISVLKHPRLIWRREFSEVRGIEVDDSHLYFPDGEFGLRIYSLTGNAPKPLSKLDTPGWNCDLFILRDTAYLADGGHGLRVVDITDRKHPEDRGSVDIKVLLREIHAIEGVVFGAAQAGGVVAFDVTDPQAPTVAARHQTVDDARGVFTDGRFVYCASGSGGVYIFEYSR